MDFHAMLREARKKAAAPAASSSQSSSTANSAAIVKPVALNIWKETRCTNLLEKHSPDISPQYKENLEKFRVGEVPSVFYIPDFVSTEEETKLLNDIYNSSDKWVQLKARRLQNWGGNPSFSGMKQEPLPEWLAFLSPRLMQQGILPMPFNHVLINEYQPGEGIMPHTDGPLYYPQVAIVSLQSGLMLDIYEARSPEKSQIESRSRLFSVYLQPRSLLVFRDDVYKNHFHGIATRTIDPIDEQVINAAQAGVKVSDQLDRANTRVSLTIRLVPLVLEEVT